MRISKITLKDFRGFPGEYEFALDGKNLLIHGENGAGKSSLFHALDQFLQASQTKTDIISYHNIFVDSPEPSIKLDIVGFTVNGDRAEGSGVYEWSTEASPENQALIEEAAKTRGCLDYKALLHTHFVHLGSESVDIFDLLLESLLVHFENPITKRRFGEEWKLIRENSRTTRTVRDIDELVKMVKKFDHGMKAVIPDLAGKANELLSGFAHNIKLDLVTDGSVEYQKKALLLPQVYLNVRYADVPIIGHHRFLNEARLSAIAIVLYLASVLLNPASRMKIIVLDDVLIGLDMSNRMPVLNLLRRYFSDWQIIILTHDRVWFEMVRYQTGEADWCYYELHCSRDVEKGFDRPYSRNINEGWTHLLDKAKYHLRQNDERAAAVYARAAFENWAKKYCDKKKVPVPFNLDSSRPEINELWDAIKKWLVQKKQLVSNQQKIDDLQTYRRVVLNPLSHETAVQVVRAEIEGAINAVEALKNLP